MLGPVDDMDLASNEGEHEAIAVDRSQPTARIHHLDAVASPTRRPQDRPQHVETDAPQVALARWDDLFSRIEHLLRLTLGERPASTAEAPTHLAAGQVPATVSDAVAALSELHTSLVRELTRRRQLESELAVARAALAREHRELLAAQAVEKQTRHLALHDGLTSLPNRSYFHAQLQRGLSPVAVRPRALALLYLDLDGFKAINDTHGHAVGDELLRIVAARLRRVVRAGDMVSRVGGDEFACLPADPLDRPQLTELAFSLFNSVSAPIRIGNHGFTVRPSIGIAVFPVDGKSVDALLRSADAAMYRAKRLQTRVEFFGRHASA